MSRAAVQRVSFGVALLASAAACGGRAYDATSTNILTNALTSADVPAEESISDRIARAVCVHEVECGRAREADICLDRARMQTARELAAWTCDETSARTSAEQCLVSVRSAACYVELGAGRNVCPQNGGCASIESDPAASR